MFTINYRITDAPDEFMNLTLREIEEGAHVEGFFQIIVNNFSYGYFPRDTSYPNEEGDQLLTNWFESLLGVLMCFKRNEQYIDAYRLWLEFKRIDVINVCISKLDSENKGDTQYLVFTRPKNATYETQELYHQIVPLDEIEQEIKIKTLSYLQDIEHLSQELAEGKTMLSLKKLYNEVFNPENRH